MNRSRNILFLVVSIVVIGGVALFAWQNWSPSLSLKFLGLQSIPLPLSVWIVGSLIAGVITYLFIYAIFELSNYLLKQNLQPAKTRPRKSQYQDETVAARDRAAQEQASSDSQSNFNLNKNSEPTEKDENYDDWEKKPPQVNSSWENSTDESNQGEAEESSNQTSTAQNYEVEQQPKTESWSGSVYSYGYRDPSSSGVGQTESVYDADYRVITPPPSAETSTSTQKEKEENEENPHKDDQLGNQLEP